MQILFATVMKKNNCFLAVFIVERQGKILLDNITSLSGAIHFFQLK
jgi:hypothetical protein